MRECGGCTRCCFHAAVPEQRSGVNAWCSKCANGGCSVYADRPLRCSSFECLWLSQEQIPESMRPDVCHVMFEIPYGSMTVLGHIDPKYPDAWEDENVMGMVSRITAAGYSVAMLLPNGTKQFALSPGQTFEGMKAELENAIGLLH